MPICTHRFGGALDVSTRQVNGHFCSRWLAAPILFALCNFGFAQQIGYRQYLQQDGLANLNVDCLLQDHAKSIWVCTDNGLYRYDGARFVRFGTEAGIEHARIYAIAEDSAERIWAGNTHNLYVGKNGRFAEVFDHGKSMEIGVGAKLAVDRGRMLAIAAQKLYAIKASDDGAGWQVDAVFPAADLREQPALQALSALYVEPGGVIWLGCGNQICRVDDAHVRTWEIDAGAGNTWQSFLLDSHGQLWARSFDHVAVLRPGAARFEYRDPPGGRLTTAQPFVQMVEDRQGRIVSRTDGGLLRWSADIGGAAAWEHFDGGNGLPSTYMLSLLVDHEGSLWIGTNGNGLLRWQGYENWESWTTLQGLNSNTIWSIFRDAHRRLLVGSGGGCNVLDLSGRRFEPCKFKAASDMREINAMAQTPDHSLWLTTMSGEVARVDSGNAAHRFATLPYIRYAQTDRAGDLWLMTYRGVYRIAPGTKPGVPGLMNVSGAEAGDFSDAVEDRGGNMWFASTRGLYKFADKEWSRTSNLDERASSGFRSLALDLRGQAWLAGSFHGLLKASLVHGSVVEHAWVTDPLVADTAISSVRADARGLVWLGTDNGLLMFDGGRWRRFSQADGLIWNDISQTSFFIDTDGSIWVGTSAGLSHITHPERLLESEPLHLRIVRAVAGSQSVDVPGKSTVDWRKNLPLDLDFAVAEFTKTEGIVFRYRLIGLESEWSETRSPQVRYSSLEPGQYRLEVIAEHPEHGLSSPRISVSFTVRPPWWRTTFAQVLGAGCLAAGLFVLWRWRIRRMVALQRSLQRDLREREVLLQRATRDTLTGLWNRAAILDLLTDEMNTAAMNGSPLAVALIDLDHFKRINDTHGHLAGDLVLRTLGEHLRKIVRSTDGIGRYGGEELLLLMPGLPQAHAFTILESLRSSIQSVQIEHMGISFGVTASFGVAWLLPGQDTPELLIGRADAALYGAKRSGRNRVEYWRVGDDAPVAAA